MVGYSQSSFLVNGSFKRRENPFCGIRLGYLEWRTSFDDLLILKEIDWLDAPAYRMSFASSDHCNKLRFTFLKVNYLSSSTIRPSHLIHSVDAPDGEPYAIVASLTLDQQSANSVQ